MSRCRACDTPLYGKFSPYPNKHTHKEDDLCTVCNALSKYDFVDHEYTGGANPREGLTAPAKYNE